MTEIFKLQDQLAEARHRVHALEKCMVGDMADLKEATAHIIMHKETFALKADALEYPARVLERHADALKGQGRQPLSWKFERH